MYLEVVYPKNWKGGRFPLVIGILFLMSLATSALAQAKFVTEYRLDRDVLEIPFEYKDHQILVQGGVDKKSDLTFLFDTGASSPVLDSSLGVTGYHLADTEVQQAEGLLQVESVWVDSLRVTSKEGGAEVSNISVLLTDLSQISKVLGKKIDGILGITFMAGYITEIDYAHQKLRFYPKKTNLLVQRTPDNQRTFLFNLLFVNPLNPACLALYGQLHTKYDYDFLLDTGFGGYVSVSKLAAEESGILKPETPRISSTNYSVTNRFKTDKFRVPFLMLGEINLSGRIVQADIRNKNAYGQRGIVGNRFLQNYHVILDYARRKLWLERVTTKEEPDEAEKLSLGLAIRANGATIRVDRVSKNSPAQRSGVKPGDKIISINGQAIATISTTEVANLLASPHGETRLALIRGIDPNLGIGGQPYSLLLQPSSPLDWKGD